MGFLFLVTCIIRHFEQLKDIPQSVSHSSRLSRSCWSWSQLALDFIPLYMMLSSTNSWHLEFTCSDMLLMKVRKRIGPTTLICVTSDVTPASSEHSPFTTTLWDPFFRKSSIQSRHGPFMPLYWNFSRRHLCGTTSEFCWSPWWLLLPLCHTLQ